MEKRGQILKKLVVESKMILLGFVLCTLPRWVRTILLFSVTEARSGQTKLNTFLIKRFPAISPLLYSFLESERKTLQKISFLNANVLMSHDCTYLFFASKQ